MTRIPRPCLRCRALTTQGSMCPRCTEASRPGFRDRRQIGGWGWARLRAAVRARDGACVRCGVTAGLEVHHILPLARGGSNALGNLETLCRACHRASHRS